jgi:hypothetical protein
MFLLMTVSAAEPPARTVEQQHVVEITGHGPAVLWRYPNDIATRNLYYGRGGQAHAPGQGVYTFVKEDMNGTNPKFDVTDENGVKWKVKMGAEARPETVASRFVWALGYFADEDYFVPVLHVKNAPTHLQRGHIQHDGTVEAVRMKRSTPGQKKIGTWEWMNNPFIGKREFNGLRVLMAVINNWDLKDENNALFQAKGPDGPFQLYEVSDLGASFGTPGFGWTKRSSRGNVKAYTRSKWIRRTDEEIVDFNVPSRPAIDHYPAFHEWNMRMKLRRIGWGIPLDDARWMGDLLGQLSAAQIRDAFRAGGYDALTVERFSREVEERIAELKTL